jgi:predicted Zn-dependent protease
MLLLSCSIQPAIPSVPDSRIEDMVRSDAALIVSVTEDADNFSQYQFLLSNFPRQDLLGMSVGNRRIYISYNLASLALNNSKYRWLLRQTIAHEIAHETAQHAQREQMMWFRHGTLTLGASGTDVGLPWYVRLYNYSAEKELEADLKGLGYWSKVGWDCRIWVDILENFQKQNYTGDMYHPTDKRLQQARRACDVQRTPADTPELDTREPDFSFTGGAC